MTRKHLFTLLTLALLGWSCMTAGYPLYGSEERGILRLQQARLAHEGIIPGRQKLPGELLPLASVDLRLLQARQLELPAPDPGFTAAVRSLLGADTEGISLAILDLSDPGTPRYAGYRDTVMFHPGSIGKLVVAAAMFQALADAWPDNLEKRLGILRDTRVVANELVIGDEHKVRLWDPESQTLTRRPLQTGDSATLWNWLDWMLSASSNAAASVCMQQTLLLAHFGRQYPVTDAAARQFLEATPKKELSRLLLHSLQGTLQRSGIDTAQFSQGSFFTQAGKAQVPGGSSHANSRELVTFLLRLEQGRVVDEFSSRELKRLLYITEQRTRYAASPALHDAAVYYKSGSLYACSAEVDGACPPFRGDRINIMNSVAIVESPAGEPRYYYLVSLQTNRLRQDAARLHWALATRLHELIQAHAIDEHHKVMHSGEGELQEGRR
jgi:hypothetical protein